MKTPTVHADAPHKAIGYVRVSTHEQAQEGVSLDAQREKLRELRAQGLSLRAIALRLQQEGYQHARGSCWHAAGVSALLTGL